MDKNNIIKYEGELDLVGIMIPCFVLQDGTRVLSGRAIQEAMRIREKPEEGGKRGGYILPSFFASKALKPFVDSKLEVAKLNPLICYRGNQVVHGYEATLLADLCDAVLEARRSGEKLTSRQEIVADQCEILIRSFAKVGIIALVDEATGYQYDREEKELQVILKALVSDEILQYQKQFQLSFYREIFRLWGIPFTAYNIRHKPQFIGHLTNKYIYSNLPKGTIVLEHLKSQTPKTEAGNWKFKLHQSLTEDKGREALKKVLYTVEALASISKDKNQFEKLIKEKYGVQKELPFPEMPELDKPAPKEQPTSDFNQKLMKAIEYNPKNKTN